MKFVYVLTSSPEDLYYEQFLLSLTSFRMYNPQAELVVLIDRTTMANLTGKRAAYKQLIPEIKVIDVPDEYSQKEASRYIKTSIHHYIDDDFLFIDCDTVIASELHCNFTQDIQIGAVLDNHTYLAAHRQRETIIADNHVLGFDSIHKQDCYYNGGLIFCRNTGEGRIFFEKWHQIWLASCENGNSQDMPALNHANYELGGMIHELDGSWNCQIAFGGLAWLYNAKMIHYYASELRFYSSPYAFSSPLILRAIKESGAIPAEIVELLKQPLSAFEPNARIISDVNMLEVLNSSLFAKLIWMQKSHTSLFRKIDTFTGTLTKAVKRIAGKGRYDRKRNTL